MKEKIYLEIRKGAGGKESELFMEDLLRMYVKFIKNHNLSVDLIKNDKTKIILIEGYKNEIDILRNESGVHRVQRVPKTEKKGKLQTSTVSVAVVDFSEIKKIKLNENDLEFQAYRASGAGGQHRNTTDSAIRLIHKPTKVFVISEGERSQYKNKEIAKELLIMRLMELEKEKFQKNEKDKRYEQIGSADRAESKRTYNFQRNEVVDNNGKKARLKDILDKSQLELLN